MKGSESWKKSIEQAVLIDLINLITMIKTPFA